MPKKGKEEKKTGPIAREYTINLHKRIHKIGFKRRAPRAVKEIKKFAQKAMGTNDVRVSSDLNVHIWSQGVKSVPRRVRVRLERKKNSDENAAEEYYTLCTYVPVPKGGFKELQNQTIEINEEK